MGKRNVNDRMMDLSAKVGVHPYHLTNEHVLNATGNGDLTTAECEELLAALADATGDFDNSSDAVN
jgi:hypothetical protein